jgi:HSP20 family molecular chaperone IbpA
VDQASIKAEFKDGVLRLTLPKREEAKPKQIQISVAK